MTAAPAERRLEELKEEELKALAAEQAQALRYKALENAGAILGGLSFLGIQYYEYSHLVGEGITFATSTWKGEPINDLFGSTFYAITGFHGAHVLTGVIYLTVIFIKSLGGRYDAAMRRSVQTAVLYEVRLCGSDDDILRLSGTSERR